MPCCLPACLPACLQELAALGGPLPLKLYASANRSPLLAGACHDVDPTVMHRLPGADFWAAMDRRYGRNPNLVGACCKGGMQRSRWHGAVLSPASMMPPLPTCCWACPGCLLPPLQEHPAVRRLLLPMLQADFRLIETWEGPPDTAYQLPCPIAALGATADVRYCWY